VLESIRDAVDMVEENHRVVEAGPMLFGLVCVHALLSLSQSSKFTLLPWTTGSRFSGSPSVSSRTVAPSDDH
jgi:hypothetical protein